MTIRRIHIASFGPLRDFDCELYSGMNVIRGDNESGKTSLAMFIKFIFYGLSGRSIDNTPSERKKYVNWETGTADGYIIASHEGREYRIERNLAVTVRAGSDKESYRETLSVTDTATGGRVPELEDSPGTEFFGVNEQVFVNTVFSGQNGRSRIDGAETAAAVENLLFSADENINVKKAAEKLDKYRRVLLHKKGSGGEIPAMREKCIELKGRLDRSSASSAEIIDLEIGITANKAAKTALEDDIRQKDLSVKYYEAELMCREGESARSAERSAATAEEELREALSRCLESPKLEEGRRLAAAIEGERHGTAEFSERLAVLEVGAESLENLDAPADPEALLEEYRQCKASTKNFTVMAVIPLIFSLITGVLAGVLYVAKKQIFLYVLAAAALLFVLSGLFFILRFRKTGKMRRISDVFDADDEVDIEAEVNYCLTKRAEAEDMCRKAESVRMLLEQSRDRAEALETEAEILADSFEDCCKGNETLPPENDALKRLRRAISLAERRQSEAEAKKAAYDTASAVAAAKRKMIPKEKFALAVEYLRSVPRPEAVPANDAEADSIHREIAFNQAKLDALLKKVHTAEVELASKRAVSDEPAKLWEELSSATEQLKRMNLRHDAAVLAAETLAEAGENMRRGVIPKVVRRASSLFTDATDGRYESLGSGSEFSLSAVMDGHTRDSKFLSAGTEDLAYVCLRIALATELFGDKRPPLIFDESLAFMDQRRSEAAKEALAMSGHQVLLFTCRPEDAVSPTLKMKRN